MEATDFHISTETKLKRIAWLSERDKEKVFNNLMHLFNIDSLRDCFNPLDGRKAVGIDGVDKGQYKLRLNEDKTKLVEFSKRGARQGMKQGVFDFLGFTFYWGRSRKGYAIPKVKTSGKRLRAKLKKVKLWARKIRNQLKLKEIWRRFCIKLNGHIRYYGVSFNAKSLSRFSYAAIRILFKWLNRRSQRKSFDWDKFNLFIKRYPPPKIKVYHSLF